ncbi:MAG TPA: cytochrome c family protein [Geobacteraceae bacterium]|nr:cytochrome c family protein [Geobacteraceae bacterium]
MIRCKNLCSAVTMFALLLLLAAIAAAEPAVFSFDRSFYPYYPSLIKWEKSDVPFTPPQKCAQCHVKQYTEWNGSVHNMALEDPIYQGELNKAVKAVGHDITRQCEGCHSPAGMLTGEIKGAGLAGLSPMALAGVSCDICHSISGVTHQQTPSRDPENGSMILAPGENGMPVKRAPFKPGPTCGGGFHKCEQSSFQLKADLCASCHQVYHYDSHFPLEATYNEWKSGPYAQLDILCQDCHMVDIATFRQVADTFKKPARSDYRHYFNGANYLLSYLGATAAKRSGDTTLAKRLMSQYDMAVERLKSAADLEITPVYRDGALAEVKVRVKNMRAGHNLPTSLTNIRQMWLEITARDESGKVLLTSGTVRPDGSLPEEVRIFNSDGMGKDFHFAVHPWVVTAFQRHDTIPARGYKDVYYGINPLEGVKNVSVEVKLRYRQADQGVAEALLAAVPKDIDLSTKYGIDKVPQLPVVDMVVKEEKLSVSKK